MKRKGQGWNPEECQRLTDGRRNSKGVTGEVGINQKRVISRSQGKRILQERSNTAVKNPRVRDGGFKLTVKGCEFSFSGDENVLKLIMVINIQNI